MRGRFPHLPGWSCPLRALTGIPCPTCYLSRATAAALSGDLSGAVQLHAFGPPLAAVLLGWSLLALHQRRLRPHWRGRPLTLPPWAVIGLAITLLAYWGLRLATGAP